VSLSKKWVLPIALILVLLSSSVTSWGAAHNTERKWQSTPALTVSSAAAATSTDGDDPRPEPDGDCPVGLVCYTIPEWKEIDKLRRDLREEVKRLRSRSKSQSLSVGYLANLDVQGLNIDYEYRIWKFYASGGIVEADPYVRGGIRFNF